VRRYALHGICDSNTVRLSVTLVDCVHMFRPTIITFIPKFEGGDPEREH